MNLKNFPLSYYPELLSGPHLFVFWLLNSAPHTYTKYITELACQITYNTFGSCVA